MLFTGADSLNLDAKGRLTMPTAHREPLMALCQGELMVTLHWMERCLLLVPTPTWKRVIDEIIGTPTFDKVSQMTVRLVLGHAKPVKMDGNNRILIPPNLREAVGLEKEVQLIGVGEKFELWRGTEIETVKNAWYDTADSIDQEKLPEHVRKLVF